MRKANESLAEPFRIATFRVPKALHSEFVKVAAANQRTFSQEIRFVMERYVAEQDEQAVA